MLYCIDADAGRMEWARNAYKVKPFVGRHRKYSFASETPVTDGKQVYACVVYDSGICDAYDSGTGKQVFKARIGTWAAYSSSPCAADGKIVCLSKDGDTCVLQTGDEYQLIARNSIGEMWLSTPAIADGSLFIRTMNG